ncbi:NCS2 family permease [Helicobacter salomonis]|uniref:NCS2 family permease n=1 Tax=Helicobacter salomonis TaxID=56878 RepID=UPI001F1753FC|nr:NCS2 family permease [Helicobacter salomonis]
MLARLEQFFGFGARQTNLRTEIIAGISTFVTMAYILVVNPAILQQAGMDFEGVFVATILASVLGTLIMGIVANYPIAIAPGMGMNAYFTFVIVLGMKIPWQSALASVFIASLIFLLLSLTRFRQALINAIPPSLKASISAGIGLFIAFIGMQNAHLISASNATLVTLGNFSDPIAYMSLLGLFVSVVLLVKRVPAAIFLGMLLSALFCALLGKITLPETLIQFPEHATSTFFKLDFKAFTPDLLAVIFTFFLIMLFDTTATMIGIAQQAKLTHNGDFANAKSALCADALASTFGALAGTSPTSAYIESGAGVSVGGRTGFTCVVIALLFVGMLFLAPLAKVLASVPAITAPALIIVGFLMMSHLSQIDWHNLEESLPAFFVLFWIPLSYSITSGVGAGLILYPLLKIVCGKFKQVHPLLYLFMILFIIQFVLEALHSVH